MHDDKTRELIERYCSGVNRNVVISRSVNDKRCVCLNRDRCDMGADCKYCSAESEDKANFLN